MTTAGPPMQLHAMRIPPCLRGAFEDLPAQQAFDLWVEGGDVMGIVPTPAPARGTVLSAFVDAHVHLDKAYTVAEVGAARGDLAAAITRSAAHRATWTPGDVRRRMARALEDAWSCGTRAMRTHLDWVSAEPPVALPVFEQMRDLWRGRIELQAVALVPLDLWADAPAGQHIAEQVAVAAAGGTVALGAFVYRNEGMADKLGRLFALAAAHNLPLDFHVDEGLDTDAVGLQVIADLALGQPQRVRVVCGHACSLSVQSAAHAARTLRACDRAGIELVALPTTNLYLQGSWRGTPVERGITRLNEAVELGLRPSIASDNVADPFYPYGSYDLLETFGLGVQVAHLAPADDWLASITVNPARALGLHWNGRIAEGCPADLVCLAACSDHELLTPAGRRRRVMRQGRFL